MADFNTKYILSGDDKDTFINKINNNFYQVFFNGVGEKGPDGNMGATGITGQAGRKGLPGATGERAAEWFFSSAEPSNLVSLDGDIWVNIGSTGGQQVFIYSAGSWIYTGETLLSSGVFSTLTGISGPGNSTSNNAIFINGNQLNKTMVLSDVVGSTAAMNPNFSKVIVSTDTAQTADFPIIGFSKTFLPQTPENIVSLEWDQTGNSYSHRWSFPNEIRVQSGMSSTYSATGGSMILRTPNRNIVGSSQSLANFTAATGTSGAFSFSTSSILNLTSPLINLTPSAFSISLQDPGGTGYIASTVTPSVPLVDLSGSGSGVNISSSLVSDDDLLQVLNTTDQNFIRAKRSNKFSFGSVGATGLKKVKGITTTSQIFLTDGTDSYVNSGNPTNDICVIVPPTTGSPVANGKANRVMLSLGSNFGWATGLISSGQSRTFDFFMNSPTYSFGGIRVIPSSGLGFPTRVYIDDNSAGPGGCQHIRITFFPLSVTEGFHYEAFSDDNYKCGQIIYTLEATIGIPGPTETLGL